MAQQPARDSRGKDFWLAFLPTEHNATGSRPVLAIYVTSPVPTSGVVSGITRSGTEHSVPFAITVPNDVVRITLATSEHELQPADAEQPVPMAVHVTAQNDVSVYALSRETQSADAWCALPTDVLGTTHRVMSYPSDAAGRTDPFTGQFVIYNTYPGQFAVIAAYDSTQVDITLPVPRSGGGRGQLQHTMLHRGDVYLVMAAVTPEHLHDDMTGALVSSSKPVGVLGSHKRAQVPILDPSSSRDLLVEQMPAVDTWGRHILVVPPARPSDTPATNPADASQCRIMGSVDGTTVVVNGVTYRIDGGAVVDLPLYEPLTIDADQPVLAAIVTRSENRNGVNTGNGDPFLLVVPPVEQFLHRYSVVNIEPVPGQTAYTQQFVTITAPMSAQASLTVDGVRAGPLVPIPGSTFGYVHVPTVAGSHDIGCDSTFGTMIYGYGNAESYGYTGGMSYEQLTVPTVVLRPTDVVGIPGDRRILGVIVDSISDIRSMTFASPRYLHARLTWNVSMCVPDSNNGMELVRETATLPITATLGTLHVGDTLWTTECTLALGTAQVSDITVDSASWHLESGDTLRVSHRYVPGILRTDSICIAGGPRLFDPLAGSVGVRFDAQESALYLETSDLARANVVLELYDMQGALADRQQATLASGIPVRYVLPQSGPGIHILRVHNGTRIIFSTIFASPW